MFYNVVTDLIEAIKTVQLYEDMSNCQTDSDFEDEDYHPYVHVSSTNPSTNPEEIQLQPQTQPLPEIPTAPLPDPFRQPREIRNPNPDMIYYETEQYPSDNDYNQALFTILSTVNLVNADESYEQLRFPVLNDYIQRKWYNINYSLPKHMWNELMNRLLELQLVAERLIEEEQRLTDLSYNLEAF